MVRQEISEVLSNSVALVVDTVVREELRQDGTHAKLNDKFTTLPTIVEAANNSLDVAKKIL